MPTTQEEFRRTLQEYFAEAPVSSVGGARNGIEDALFLNPFDWKTVFLARHARHVVFIHFTIALFATSIAFDLVAHCGRRRALADAAYYNLLVAAGSIPLVATTGILAWHLQLEGQKLKLKGIPLSHLLLAALSGGLAGAVGAVRMGKNKEMLPGYRFVFEILAVVVVGITGYLGGFLSGVNRPG